MAASASVAPSGAAGFHFSSSAQECVGWSFGADRRFTILSVGEGSAVEGAILQRDGEKVRRLVEGDPSLIKGSNKQAWNLVAMVCFYGGEPKTLECLLKHGGDPRVLLPGGYTPRAIAEARGHYALARLLPHDTWYTPFFLDTKELGHALGIQGSVWVVDEVEMELEGLWSNNWVRLLGSSLQGYSRHAQCRLSRGQVEELLAQLRALDGSTFKVGDCKTHLAADRPFLILTGWYSHSIFVLFWRSYLIVCDPAANARAGTLRLFKIEPALITQEVIDCITSMRGGADKDVAVEFFNSELPDWLGEGETTWTDEDQSFDTCMQGIAPEPIKVGICSFASLFNALRAVALMQGVGAGRDLDKVARFVEGDFNRWHAYMQARVFFNYVMRWGDDWRVDRELLWEAHDVVRRGFGAAFPHQQDVRVETRSGVVRGDELMVRARKVILQRTRRERRYGRT